MLEGAEEEGLQDPSLNTTFEVMAEVNDVLDGAPSDLNNALIALQNTPNPTARLPKKLLTVDTTAEADLN